MIGPEAVVTFDRVEGFRIVRALGYVQGVAVHPRDVLRDTLRGIGQLVGLAPLEYLTEAEKARERALEEMRLRADEIGANGIINVQFQTCESPQGTQVVAFGKAVVLEVAGAA
jgi:uncharacterized protein YbjQ (UPF0145 family)